MKVFIPLLLAAFMVLAVPKASAQIVFQAELCTLVQDYVPKEGTETQSITGKDLTAEIFPVEIPIRLDLIQSEFSPPEEELVSEPLITSLMLYRNGQLIYGGHDVSGELDGFCLENVPGYKSLAELHEGGSGLTEADLLTREDLLPGLAAKPLEKPPQTGEAAPSN